MGHEERTVVQEVSAERRGDGEVKAWTGWQIAFVLSAVAGIGVLCVIWALGPPPKDATPPPTSVVAPQVVVSQDKVMVQRVAENLARDRVSIEQTRQASQRDSEARSAMRPTEKPVVAPVPPGKFVEVVNEDAIANCVAGPVEEELKNPRDAQWGPPVIGQEGPTTTDKETRRTVKFYRVTGWVDATNSFGAWQRMKYTGLVREDGGAAYQVVPGSIVTMD
jgi:hypothetical protein